MFHLDVIAGRKTEHDIAAAPVDGLGHGLHFIGIRHDVVEFDEVHTHVRVLLNQAVVVGLGAGLGHVHTVVPPGGDRPGAVRLLVDDVLHAIGRPLHRQILLYRSSIDPPEQPDAEFDPLLVGIVDRVLQAVRKEMGMRLGPPIGIEGHGATLALPGQEPSVVHGHRVVAVGQQVFVEVINVLEQFRFSDGNAVAGIAVPAARWLAMCAG